MRLERDTEGEWILQNINNFLQVFEVNDIDLLKQVI